MVKGDEVIMCRASKLLNELFSLKEEYEKEMNRLSKLQSKYDREVNLIYHDIEKNSFNAAEGYYLSKRLQDTLRKRRLVKEELYKLNAINYPLQFERMDGRLNHATGILKKINKDRKEGYTKNWDLKLEDFEHEYVQ